MAKTPVNCFTVSRTASSSGLRLSPVPEVLLDQVGDDFGVGLGGELVAFGDQLLLQRDIVLDNAVVDDDDLAGAVAMGMGVLFRGTPVRGPAGVADAVGAVERLQADDLFQVAQLAFSAANLQASAIAGNRDARRVVAAILQPAQAINDDRHYALLADVTNNSAHNGTPRAPDPEQLLTALQVTFQVIEC